MKNKKQNQGDKKLEEVLAKFSEEELEFVRTSIVANEMFEIIVMQLDIEKDDEIFRAHVTAMLKRRAHDHLVMAIWSSIGKEQLKHFKDFLNQSAVTVPEKPHDTVLIEFALLYPELMKKVYESLTKFFKNFIKKFNEISAA